MKEYSPIPLEEEFDDAFYALVDNYKDEFISKGWTIEEFSRLCHEKVNNVIFPTREPVDIKNEVNKVLRDGAFHMRIESGDFKTTILDYQKIAHHFYNLGLKAR